MARIQKKGILCQFHMPYPNRRTGFTLIELSLVLVITGLVIGGLLAGKSLIQQAEIRSAASQLQKMETAYRTFQIKYGCIVGDCPNATDLFGVNYITVGSGCPPSGGTGDGNGNGDGLIKAWSGWAGGGDWNCETAQASSSLRLSNLMPTEERIPACLNTTWGFVSFNNSCAYYYADDLYAKITPIQINGIAWATIDASGRVRSGAISPVQARLIDEKIDNGDPTTGKFRGLDASVQSTGGSIVDDSCSTSGVYNLNDDYTCRSLYYFK